jgi:hypothetical protein
MAESHQKSQNKGTDVSAPRLIETYLSIYVICILGGTEQSESHSACQFQSSENKIIHKREPIIFLSLF